MLTFCLRSSTLRSAYQQHLTATTLAYSTMSRKAVPIDGQVIVVPPNGHLAPSSSDQLPSFQSQWDISRADATKPGIVRILAGSTYPYAAVSLGQSNTYVPKTGPDAVLDGQEGDFLRNEALERTRVIIAKGVRALRDLGPLQQQRDSTPVARSIAVDPTASPHAAATGALLALYQTNHFRSRGPTGTYAFEGDINHQGGKEIHVVPSGDTDLPLDGSDPVGGSVPLGWRTGVAYAEAQNFSRELAETPANLMTPTIFCQRAQTAFTDIAGTQVIVHDAKWAEEKGMGCFLSVTHGTAEPAKVLEVHYKYPGGGEDVPTIGIVGKGITFDTGGISLKPGLGMKLMKGDMMGAASGLATTHAIAKLGLRVNVVFVAPLTENLPGPAATKPGDVVKSMKGLTVEIDNTDAEGRLVLSDCLTYVSREYKPTTLIALSTLTGAIRTALGTVYTGAFVEDPTLWSELQSAGKAENDRLWRMPLDDDYLYSISGTSQVADLVNVGRPAGACSAAIFLKQFVEGLEDRKLGIPPHTRFAHLDLGGTMESDFDLPYQDRFCMTGRPTRLLIEWARRLAAAAAGEGLP